MVIDSKESLLWFLCFVRSQSISLAVIEISFKRACCDVLLET